MDSKDQKGQKNLSSFSDYKNIDKHESITYHNN